MWRRSVIFGVAACIAGCSERSAESDASIPGRANATVDLRDPSGAIAVTLRLEDALPIDGAPTRDTTRDTTRFRGGWRGEGDLLRQTLADGFEDFIVLERRPSEERMRYALRLATNDVGLRMVGRALEILDPDGAPRLRMAPPWVMDAGGTPHAARVTLEGCLADADPSAPWGRPVTRPGSRSCVVIVDWSGLDVTYPATVDPLWSSAGSMSEPRWTHTATLLQTGRVLVVGGQGLGVSGSAEQFDPSTSTWAMTASLPDGHVAAWHSADLLLDGRVVVAGGFAGVASFDTTFLYDPTAGTWTTAGPLIQARNAHASTRLADGRVLVCGGEGPTPAINIATAEVFDPASSQWSAAGAAQFATQVPTASTLPDGRVLVAGGRADVGGVSDVALFDPRSGVWSFGPNMLTARYHHRATSLPNGDVLVTGGFNNAPDPTPTVERFDAASGAWTSTRPMLTMRAAHAAAPLPGGRVLVAGGLDNLAQGSVLASAEIYEPGIDAWTEIEPLATKRSGSRATALADGTVLVSGGSSPDLLNSAERLTLIPNGAACTTGATCVSGNCVGAICCDTACEDDCHACTATEKGRGVDGVCGFVAAKTDPRNDCLDSGATCDLDGMCDGAGACSKYPTKAGCAAAPCTAGQQCASGFCADGVCCDQDCDGPCRSCSKATGALEDGLCQAARPGSDDAKVCAPYGCNVDGSCKVACATVDDCGAPTFCSAEGRCVTPKTEDEENDDGCGCRLPRSKGAGPWWAALPAALAAIFARRRRRAVTPIRGRRTMERATCTLHEAPSRH